MMRKRFEASNSFDANERRIGALYSIGDGSERGSAVGAPHFAKLRRATLELGDDLLGRYHVRIGRDVGAKVSARVGARCTG
jgi:hypothetical protein